MMLISKDDNAERSMRSDSPLVQGGRSGVRVHFYVVGKTESARNVVVCDGDVNCIESVQNFDRSFTQSSIKIVFLN